MPNHVPSHLASTPRRVANLTFIIPNHHPHHRIPHNQAPQRPTHPPFSNRASDSPLTPASQSAAQQTMDHPQTPRVLASHLEQFRHRIVRVLGKVVQLKGESAVIDAGGHIDVQLNRVRWTLQPSSPPPPPTRNASSRTTSLPPHTCAPMTGL